MYKHSKSLFTLKNGVRSQTTFGLISRTHRRYLNQVHQDQPNPQSSEGGNTNTGVYLVAAGTLCVGIGGLYYYYPELFHGYFSTQQSKSSEPKTTIKKDDNNRDLMKELEQSIESEFKAKSESSHGAIASRKGKINDSEELVKLTSEQIVAKLRKVDEKCEEFAKCEKKLSMALSDLQSRIKSTKSLTNEQYISLLDEIMVQYQQLQLCRKESEKCKCVLDKVVQFCANTSSETASEQGSNSEDLITLAESTKEKLSSVANSLFQNSANIKFTQNEVKAADEVNLKFQLEDSSLWVDKSERDSGRKSNDELTIAFEEAEKKLKTLRCMLINTFLSQQRPYSSTSTTADHHSSNLTSIQIEEMRTKLESEFEDELNLRLEEQRALLEKESLHRSILDKELLEKKFEKEMKDEMEALANQYAQKDALTCAKLQAIESAVDEKADSQRKALFSHYLWLASESFRSQVGREVEIGSESAYELDKLCIPLDQFVRKLEIVNSNQQDPLVKAVISSIPSVARSRGVYTEDMLKTRFNKVCRTCYRLANVDDATHRNSLYAYLLSYLKSLFTVRIANSQPITSHAVLKLENEDNYSLLSSARCAVQRGDIGLCVKLLNHLKGKPREVAEDWLKEATLFLETKQAVRVLTLLSTATGFRASPLTSSKLNEIDN